MARSEERHPGAVLFVASRPGAQGRGAVQEWRYRTTGRTVEVAEANAFAEGTELAAGTPGFVEYEGGVPVVVSRPGTRLGRPAQGARGRSSPPPRPHRPRRGSWARRLRPFARRPGAWTLLGLAAILILVVVLAWGR